MKDLEVNETNKVITWITSSFGMDLGHKLHETVKVTLIVELDTYNLWQPRSSPISQQ